MNVMEKLRESQRRRWMAADVMKLERRKEGQPTTLNSRNIKFPFARVDDDCNVMMTVM
jgi:hypothetical protein